MSSLPPRMAEHEEKLKLEALKKQNDEEENAGKKILDPNFPYSFEPQRATPVPDFATLHATFEKQL